MIGVIQQNKMSFNFLNQISFSVPKPIPLRYQTVQRSLNCTIESWKNDMNITIKCKKVLPLGTLSVEITGVTETGSMNTSELQSE